MDLRQNLRVHVEKEGGEERVKLQRGQKELEWDETVLVCSFKCVTEVH